MTSKLIAQGAEAIITLSKNTITKDRIKKSYRIPELDEKIRKQRTKAEIKLLFKANQIINTPKPFENNSKYQIKMPFINGKKLSEHLDKFPLVKQKQILKQIGKDIAKLHDEDIIHGDLTTSNMILVEGENIATHLSSQMNKTINNKSQSNTKLINNIRSKKISYSLTKPLNRESAPIIFLIDFGLGYFNGKYEDKSVDIHLLKQALEAKHFQNWKVLFKEFEKGYKTSKNSDKIFNQLTKVEKRGRYKG